MGIAGIVTATFVVMGVITGGSAITGAVMGSHRKIGAVKGFFWGLMLPLLGIGRVIISDKLKAPSSPVQEKSDRTHNRGTAQEAARQQFSENHPQTQAETSRVIPVHREEQQQQQTQSHGRSI